MSPKSVSAGTERGIHAALGAPPQPQVNLLPPEVRSRRALGRVKVLLAGVLALVLLASAGGYVVASLEVNNAENDLQQANERVQDLLAQQSQYAEVPRIRSQIAAISEARLFATSTELMWATYWRAIEAVTPPGWTLQSLQTTLPRPGETMMPSTNLLGAPSVGTITFVGRASVVPDIADWMDGLERIPGFVDAWFSNAQITEENGVVYYEVGATVQVDASAFSGRFVPTGEDAGTGTEGSVGEDVSEGAGAETAPPASDGGGDL